MKTEHTFLITSRSFLLNKRNVSDKCCRENQNTHFVFGKIFLKIVPFMRKRGENIVERGRPHDNMAHERCILYN